jgi:prenyltransferase beta subunit
MAKNKGGVPAAKENDTPCTWSTAGIVRSIRQITKSDYANPILRRSIDWLLSDQNPSDGGFGLSRNESSCTDPTCEAIFTLVSVFEETSDPIVYEALEKAIRWLIQNGETDGGWSFFPKGDVSVICTSKALLALLGFRKTLKDSDLNSVIKSKINKGIHFLKNNKIELSEKGMAWGLSESSRVPSAATTAFAVMALLATGKISSKDVRGAIRYFEQSRKADGTWEPTIERHGGYQFVRQATPYVVMMLIESGVDFRSIMLNRAILHVTERLNQGKVSVEPGSDIVTWPTRDYLLSYAKVLNAFRSSNIDQILNMVLDSEEKSEATEKKVEELTNEAWERAKTVITVLKVIVSLLSLTMPLLLITTLYLLGVYQLDLFVNILGVFLATWGVLIVLFYNYGKIKKRKR